MLTDLKKAFVECYVANGGNAARAATQAGYSAKTAKVKGCQLLKEQEVLDAIADETIRAFAAHVPAARKVLADLMKTAKSESIRFQSAQALLDRGGLQLAQKIEHRIKDDRTDDELRQAIIDRAKRLGLTPEELTEPVH